MDGGNAMLIGMIGTGKSTLTKLAALSLEFQLFEIDITNRYTEQNWKDDLKFVLKQVKKLIIRIKIFQTGSKDIKMVFLLHDSQIIMESFLEDINNIILNG